MCGSGQTSSGGLKYFRTLIIIMSIHNCRPESHYVVMRSADSQGDTSCQHATWLQWYSRNFLLGLLSTLLILPLLSGPQLLGPGPQAGAWRWRHFGCGWHAVWRRRWQRQGECSVSESVRDGILFAFVCWGAISCFQLCFCLFWNGRKHVGAIKLQHYRTVNRLGCVQGSFLFQVC